MKRNLLLTLLMAFVLVIASACGGADDGASDNADVADDGKDYVLQAGHSLPNDHPYQIALEQMAENIDERTDGRVTIEIFPNSEIGAEKELTEGMTLGTVDLVVSSTAPVTNFIPELAVLDLPFLFEDRDSAVDILEGDIGQGMLDKMEDHGIVGLSWAENGYRHVTNSKHPIEKPEDLAGLKIRTQENPIHISAFEELGAQPTPMAWDEALTGLQQGVVDAQENPIIVADQFSLHEANQDYMSLTGHVYSVAVFMMSKQTYDELPTELADIVVEEGEAIGSVQRDLIVEMEAESLEKVKENGIEVIEDIDVAPFQEVVKPVYEEFQDEYGYEEVLNEILEAQ